MSIDMAEMPVQYPSEPRGTVEARARFYNSGNAFNVAYPPVPAATFVEEARAAFAATSSGWIACDQSRALGLPFAATTPLMLARYATVAPNGTLAVHVMASGVIWYVLRGTGRTVAGTERFAFGPGDVFVTPGGIDTRLEASSDGAVLWLVTNEPQLAFDGFAPADAGTGPVDVVRFPAHEIARQLERVVESRQNETTAGMALIFSSERQQESRNIMPTLTLSLNTVPPGEHQRLHRHNSAAVTLIVRGDRCATVVGDERCEWLPDATLVTPAGAPHSHHNDGDERAMFLIVQDGGFHYHARTMGFSFLEPGI